MKENLRPWDGTTPESWHTYPVENSPNPLLIDDGGTIRSGIETAPERLRSGALAPVSAITCTASFNWG